MRLDKYLSNMGVGTRSEVKRAISFGKVQVNGATVKKINHPVKPGEDEVKAYHQVIGYAEHVYLMLNKPSGVLSATKDTRDKTVLDLIDHPRKHQLFPVGRLDKDTVGLLVLTDDGQLAHDLLSPRKHVPKTYVAKVAGLVTRAHIQAFAQGIDLKDFKTKPATLEILAAGEASEVRVTITEGKFHQIKRMFEAIDTKVIYLKRLTMGTLVLDEDLEEGGWRPLKDEEINALKQHGFKA